MSSRPGVATGRVGLPTCLGRCCHDYGQVEDLAQLSVSVHGVAVQNWVVVSGQAEETLLHVENHKQLTVLARNVTLKTKILLQGHTASFLSNLS